jgi:peptide deformylase
MVNEILIIANKKEEKFLRKKAADFDFKKFKRAEISSLISRMRRIMREANGIGLSANQIGLNFRVFVAEVPDVNGGTKFYAVFNPKIEKVSEEKTGYEEGCLSVPGKWGDVERPEKIVIGGFDKNGRPAKIKAWGLLARVFQHEMDHLNGKLFIDRAKKIHSAEAIKK